MIKKAQYNGADPLNWALAGNPLRAGFKMGLLGAASGLGAAAIQRLIRLQDNNQQPVSVIKPMIIGSIIGSALGVANGMSVRRSAPTVPGVANWPELAQRIEQQYYGGTPMKYAGLNYIVDKQAMDKAALLPLAVLAPLAWKGLMLGGAALGGYGAIREGRKGNWLGAAGNALMAIPGIGMLGRGLKGLQMAGKLGLAGKTMTAPTVAGSRWLPNFYTRGEQALANMGTRNINALSKMSPVQGLANNTTLRRAAGAATGVGNRLGGFIPQVAGGVMMSATPGPRRPPVQMAAAQHPNRFGGLQAMVGQFTTPQAMPQFSNAFNQGSGVV